MFTHHYPIATIALLSLFNTQSFADSNPQNDDTSQDDARKNILITEGYSTPSATTQNYSGDSVIKIVPNVDDVSKSLDQLIAESSPGFVHTNSGTSKHVSNNYHRGLSDEYTLYLLNGVPFPSTTLGSQTVPDIPMESIALIEVIRGAQASLYGSNSLMGVINIITKTGENSDAQVNVSAGSHNTGRIGGVYANNFGNVHFMTSLEADKSDGYDFIAASDDDFGYQTYSMNTYAAYVTDSNRFSLAINNSQSEVEVYDNTDWTTPHGKVTNKQENYQFTGKYIQRLTQNISSEFTLSQANVDAEAGTFGSSKVDKFETDTSLAQLHLNSEWDKLAVNVGGEFTYSKYQSREDSEERKQAAVYGAFSGDVTDYLNISGGLRKDRYSDFGDALTYSAGVSLFNFASLSYKTSFSAPSYNDLYWPDVGNPNLEAEEGKILELSLTHNIDTEYAYIPLKLNFYTGSLDNKIDWAPISEGSGIWSPFNIGKVDIQGVEAYMQYNASKFVFDIAAAYSESIDKSTDKQLNNVPQWSGSSSIQYTIANVIKPKFIYSYIGERSTSFSGDLKEVHLLDFAITYQATQHVNLGFKLNNMTDNDRPLHGGYNADGRTVEFTIGAQM